jgi:leucyl-tRNA synthetase
MWTKVMFDAGLINFDEPFKRLRNHGMILAPDGRKMSKSWGNVIAPDDLIEQGYGADSVRIMELFIGPWNQEANWSVEGMGGAFRFLQRVWTLVQEHLEAAKTTDSDAPELQRQLHRATKRVTEDLLEMGYNTAIAAQMELVNDLYKLKLLVPLGSMAWQEALSTLLQLLAIFAPHLTEELWQQLGHSVSIHQSSWPSWDEAFLISDTMTIVVQVNGKLRGTIEINSNADESAVIAAAKANEKVKTHLSTAPKKSIYIPGKLVNFVV